MRSIAICLTATLLASALALPRLARAHPCEEEVAKVAEALDLENRNLLILELQTTDPRVRALRSDFDRRFLLFVSMRDQCAASVRAEKAGGNATTTPECAKDTDCKGDRICVSGACVNP